MEEVALYTAFGWVCPTCESQNYAEGVPLEITEDEQEDANELIEPDFNAEDWISMPITVKCSKCAERFKVK